MKIFACKQLHTTDRMAGLYVNVWVYKILAGLLRPRGKRERRVARLNVERVGIASVSCKTYTNMDSHACMHVHNQKLNNVCRSLLQAICAPLRFINV